MRKELCLEYDRIVTGQKKTYSSSFFKVNEEIARDNALAIMRYAFEYFCVGPLRISPILLLLKF